ncbi:hypothetical protein BDQ12DRAFT_598937 [Crucibulum laeve]|uniref:Uncharacterized protein n=1 Tax=Crucibulum laeve TaxID=68775 RepID=A0A5C3MCY1_9AGAR|nr:hypothetical protein BDQ12DRAFT_598937 [Crucibulum laeve]
MASQSILRTGVKSPARASFMKRSSTPRSILKRPAPLALSPNPFPFSASVTIQLSPSTPSPHVHFPPSATMYAMFTAHSPNTYDRAPIMISPNPLTLPSWGDRVYSPSVDGFKLSDPPRPIPIIKYQPQSPAITDFEDPRSPKLNLAGKNGSRLVTFASNLPSRGTRSLSKALSSFPRSPYPSAPVSPAESTVEEEVRGRTMERGWPKNRERGDMIKDLPARARARAPPFTPIPSPLAQSFLSPVQESPLESRRPAPLDLEPASSRLSQAFWQSVSLEETESVTSPAFPESIESSESLEVKGLISPQPAATPQFMFAGEDGSLWSPSLPRNQRQRSLRDSLLSPGQRMAFSKFSRSVVASPSPNDPFAAFPSFSIALSTGGEAASIAYPPRVALGRASDRV